jgi:hypothetical protein
MEKLYTFIYKSDDQIEVYCEKQPIEILDIENAYKKYKIDKKYLKETGKDWKMVRVPNKEKIMKLKIYAVKDVIIGSMMNPFYMHNDQQAIRSFEQAMKSESEIAKNAKDLQLFKLGEFDDETGEIVSQVEYLVKGQDFVEEGKYNSNAYNLKI